ncbi:D-aminoacylase [Candidatus Thorarchaeota archaeon]|nr:MAG: D-aminoacylase [Candidatus Thorarchaeota archaeon]
MYYICERPCVGSFRSCIDLVYDIVIKNGTVIDGTGEQRYTADIAISEGKIVKIDRQMKEKPLEIIDASDHIVCPGFIDIHSHSDMALPFGNRLESTIHQGITTTVIGNCGFSLAPVNEDRIDLIKKEFEIHSPPGESIDITWRTFAEYLDTIEHAKISSNIASLVGFGAIRIAGGPAYDDRPPTDSEKEMMRYYVTEAMEAGAFGMSTGLIYPPQVYATTGEIVALAEVVAEYKGLYFSHIRGEGETVLEAVKEVIEIVERSGCVGGQIAHHKVAGRHLWGLSKQTLHLIHEANKRGISVTCDQYPYDRGSTSLISLLPPWVHVGGVNELLCRLRSPEACEKIRAAMENTKSDWENIRVEAGWDNIFIASVKTEKWKDIEGLNLSEITKLKGYSDTYAALFELLLDENAEVTMTMKSMGDEDIERIMKSEYVMVGTDGGGVAPEGVLSHGKPHPRHYGTYPRILGRYVRKKGILTLENAIYKMSGFPAKRLGLTDRGNLQEGNWADIVIFNPETILDNATYLEPHQFPTGIPHVIVNGTIVVKEGIQGEELPGMVLRKSNSLH